MDGCYLCRPDDPDAPEEGCAECERELLEWWIAAYYSDES